MSSKNSILYLASQSPRRREILRKLKVRFRVVESGYREKNVRGLSPRQLTIRHALLKAQKAVLPAGARYVLGADTVVVCRGRILGKPKNHKEAFRMLNWISGCAHDVFTGIALLDLQRRKKWTACVRTRVFVKLMSPAEIEDYLLKVPPLDKAGAYAIQRGPQIVRRIKGSYTNVVGLPAECLKKLLINISV